MAIVRKKPFIPRDERLFRGTTLLLRFRVSRGGPEGTRTPDLLHAMETLSQLRYRPKHRGKASLVRYTWNLLSTDAITGKPGKHYFEASLSFSLADSL